MKSVRDIPEHDRPRELVESRGERSLTDEQLVMAILGSGNKQTNVRQLSKDVAKTIRLHKGKLAFDHLTSISGIGKAKASQILSAFELARRYHGSEAILIESAANAYDLIAEFKFKKQEHFICISLNGANEVIERRVVTVGLLDRTQVHPREVFADVIADRAAAVIFAHNHPSGNLKPSEPDLNVHRQLTAAAEILGIRVLDNLIVSSKGYLSFREAGLIDSSV